MGKIKILKPKLGHIRLPANKVIIPDKLNTKKNRRKTKQKLRIYVAY